MKKFLVQFISFLIFAPSLSFAGAWVEPRGSVLLINNVGFAAYNKYYNAKAKLEKTPIFIKLEYAPYFEYGVLDNLSVGFSPSFQNLSQESSGSLTVDTNSALAYTDFFTKYLLFKSESNLVVSALLNFNLHGFYNQSQTPSFGKKENFIGAGILIGKNIYEIKNRNGYINFENIYTTKTSNFFSANSGAMVKNSFTIGLPFLDEMGFAFSIYNTKSLTGVGSENPLVNRYNYDESKFEAAFIYDFSQQNSVSFKYNSNFYGRNVGFGDGFFVSYQNRF